VAEDTERLSSMMDLVLESRPTKTTTVWLCVATAVVTIATGFAWGGWVTRDTANKLAQTAALNARTALVANACVEAFAANERFATNLEALKRASFPARSQFIATNGWVTLAGMKEPLGAAADACAERLLNMKPPVANASPDPRANKGT
jgi:hypothetical protein